MNNFFIVFCEGDHDIAFLTRLLLVQGYSPYEKKVKEFPKPLDELYKTNLGNKQIEDIEFKYQKPNQKVPYAVLFKEDKLVIFHNLGGDGNILNGNAKSIVDEYITLNNENRRKIEGYEKLNYRFLYFLDADDVGVNGRITELNQKLSTSNLVQYGLESINDYEVGAAIFHKSGDENLKGKLEDILLEIMEQDNETIFEESRLFITNHVLEDDRQRNYICTHLKEEHNGRKNFKEDKSIISMAGQLQFSGSSNSVIIANTDYIKKNDLLVNSHCQAISNLFNW